MSIKMMRVDFFILFEDVVLLDELFFVFVMVVLVCFVMVLIFFVSLFVLFMFKLMVVFDNLIVFSVVSDSVTLMVLICTTGW